MLLRPFVTLHHAHPRFQSTFDGSDEQTTACHVFACGSFGSTASSVGSTNRITRWPPQASSVSGCGFQSSRGVSHLAQRPPFRTCTADTIRRIPRGNNAFFAVFAQPRQVTSKAHSLLIPVTNKTRLSRLLFLDVANETDILDTITELRTPGTGNVTFFSFGATGSRSGYHAVVVPSMGKCTLCGSIPSARSRSCLSGIPMRSQSEAFKAARW